MSSHPYVTQTQVASSTPFDNSTNGFVANDVQAAIEEASFELIDSEITATASATAGTGADALMTGMTITPAAGKYIVWFSCDINAINAGAATSVSIYVGGSQIAASLRKVVPFCGGTLTSGSARCGVAVHGTVTVNGSQAIEIRWSASSGTNTVADRTLTTLRVG